MSSSVQPAKPFFTILVPVFNTRRSLIERMATSVLNQTFRSFELLLIDDGGTAQTASMLDDFSHLDSRIVIIHAQHGGVSHARNVGLAAAKGEYVVFLDSDDELRKDCLDRLASDFSNNVEIIRFGLTYVYKNNKREKRAAKETAFFLLSEEEVEELPSKLFAGVTTSKYHRISSVFGGIAGTAIVCTLARQVLFNADINYCEDLVYNVQVSKIAKRVGIEPEAMYLYHQNEGSLVHSNNRDVLPVQIADTLKCINVIGSDITNHAVFGLRLLASLLVVIENYSTDHSIGECASLLKEICSQKNVNYHLSRLSPALIQKMYVMTTYRRLSFSGILHRRYPLTAFFVKVKHLLRPNDNLNGGESMRL